MAVTLAEIDAAISKVLTTGQSVSVEGMSYTNANLDRLWALCQNVAAESSRSGGARPIFRSFGLGGAAS